MIRLGQHGDPTHTIAHISDPHLLADGARLYGAVDTVGHLRDTIRQLEHSGIGPDAIVFTGDLADLGEPEAYAQLRAIVEPAAERMGAQVVWVMGNHDEREPYARVLFDDDAPGGVDSFHPQDRVYDLRGLRLISLDTSVPGYHHGALDPAQLDWLRDVLATPAPHGSIIGVHHPPVPSPLMEPMAMLELEDQAAFAEVVAGTDVRAILAGHLHYSCHSTFAGIPVSVAAATCYVMDLADPAIVLGGSDANQSINIVHTYPDGVLHSTIPTGRWPHLFAQPADAMERLAAMTAEQRREMFSRKDSEFNRHQQDHTGE